MPPLVADQHHLHRQEPVHAGRVLLPLEREERVDVGVAGLRREGRHPPGVSFGVLESPMVW